MKYIIFGTGEIGKKAYSFFGSERVELFCDNNKHAENELFLDKPVIEAKRLGEFYDALQMKVVLSTTTLSNVAEIAVQLYQMKIPYVLFEEEAKTIVKEEAVQYESMNPPESFRYKEENKYFFPLDRVDNAGNLNSYFWQDLWAAKRIYEKQAVCHYDIGSRVDGFIAHLLGFGQKVKLIDIRPMQVSIPGVDFQQGDATNLDTIEDESIDSLSALCSLEHFGLGRYGDPIDPMACFKCFKAIQRKIKKNGRIYISVPVGKEHLEFNAHRIFKASTIVDAFSEMNLVEYSVCTGTEVEENVSLDKYDFFENKGGGYFGLFIFEKR